MGYIILYFNMASTFESFYFSKTIKKLRQKLFIAYVYGRNTFYKLLNTLAANPRIGKDFQLTTINEISKRSFSCFRVNKPFPSTYAYNFMFTGQRSGSESNLFNNCQRNNVALSSGISFVQNTSPIGG